MREFPAHTALVAVLALLIHVATVTCEPDPFVILGYNGELAYLDLNETDPIVDVRSSGGLMFEGSPYVPPRGSPLLAPAVTDSSIGVYKDTDCLQGRDEYKSVGVCTIDEIACTYASCVGRCYGSPLNNFAFSDNRGATWTLESWPLPVPMTNVMYHTVACGLTACVVAGSRGAVAVYVEGSGWTIERMDYGFNNTFYASYVWEDGDEAVVYLAGDNILVKFDATDPFGFTHLPSVTGAIMRSIHVFPHVDGIEGRAVVVGGENGELHYSTDESTFTMFTSLETGFTSSGIVRKVHCTANMVACVGVGDESGLPAVNVFGSNYPNHHDATNVLYSTSSTLTGLCVGLRSLSTCGNGVLEGNERCEVDGETTFLWGEKPGNYTGVCLPPPTVAASGPLFPENDPNVGGSPPCPRYDNNCYFCTPGCKKKIAGTRRYCGDGVHDTPSEECDNGGSNNDAAADACRTNCMLAYCGDSVVDSGESCDGGASNNDSVPNACRTDCTFARCGDGVVDSGEACDDGVGNNNTVAGACRTNCTAQVCGDGVLDPNEECDSGNDNSDALANACRTDCTLPRCGDGVVDALEECDTGGANSNTDPNACRLNCVEPSCGDSVVDSGEQCDDGVYNNSDKAAGACRSSCVNAYCGDGVLDPGESCDDGANNTDAVPGACQLTCKVAVCGDGVIDVGEACDDGVNNTDVLPGGCRTNCTSGSCGNGLVELGEECDWGGANSNSTPNACRITCMLPYCGDGVVDASEECDGGSGNGDSPDSCRGDCRNATCGDGVVDSGEECDEGHVAGDVGGGGGGGNGGGGNTNPPDGGGNSNVLPNACRKTCLHPHCGDGVVDDGEDCDGGDCCTASCTFVSPGVVCRSAPGVCDVAEKCTGWSATCPADAFKPSGVVCRTAAAQCEVDTYCSGSNIDCGGVAYKPAGALCDDGDSCTGPYDTCSGTGGICVSGVSDMCGCGNGVLDTLEECDDGNTANGDGCADDCTIESGYYCTSAGVCSPNNNCPDSSLTRDCNGDCGGTATIDDCAVCAGGNTSRVPNANKDGCSLCFGGGAHKDSCGVCFGGDAALDACGVCHGDNSSCAGCDGVPNSGLVVDVCGDCGGNGTSCLGCDGLPIPEGGAHYDACWVCGGDSTSCHTPCMGNFTDGVPPELFDCNGTCGGTAFTDDCGVCVGGATGLPPNLHPLNCDNTTTCPLGKAVDVCGVCGGDGTSCRGCDGVPFSELVIDVCGVCGGDGSSCEVGCDGVANSGVVTDCSGVCGGSAAVDSCGMCTGGTTGKATDGHKDSCGVCFGGNRDRDSCGVCGGGDASRDDCGVCSGLNAAMDVCGVCYGASEVDVCGECNGNLTCLGCDNVPFSGVDYDDCGVCGGGCTSAVATGDSGKVKKVDEKTAATAISLALVSSAIFVAVLLVFVLVLTRVRRRQAVHAFTEQLAKDTLSAAPTGVVAMVFTDVENSTQLWELFPTHMEAALDSHNEVIRGVMARTRGYEVKTEGDAFMIAFQDAADAVDFCCEAQLELLHMDIPEVMETHPSCRTEASDRGTRRRLHDQLDSSGTNLLTSTQSSVHNNDDDTSEDGGVWRSAFLWRGLRVRMGVHYGEVLSEMSERTQRADYYGPNVNMAARVACTARAGQVVVSDAALKQVRKHVSNSDRLVVETIGDIELKGISTPVRIHQILPTELAEREFGRVLTGDAVVGGSALALATRRRESRSMSVSSQWELMSAASATLDEFE